MHAAFSRGNNTNEALAVGKKPQTDRTSPSADLADPLQSVGVTTLHIERTPMTRV